MDDIRGIHGVNSLEDFILHMSRRERALLRKIYYLERSLAYYNQQPLHPYREDHERIAYIDRELNSLVNIGNPHVRHLDSLETLLSFVDLDTLEDDTDFEDFESDEDAENPENDEIPSDFPDSMPALRHERGRYCQRPRRYT